MHMKCKRKISLTLQLHCSAARRAHERREINSVIAFDGKRNCIFSVSCNLFYDFWGLLFLHAHPYTQTASCFLELARPLRSSSSSSWSVWSELGCVCESSLALCLRNYGFVGGSARLRSLRMRGNMSWGGLQCFINSFSALCLSLSVRCSLPVPKDSPTLHSEFAFSYLYVLCLVEFAANLFIFFSLRCFSISHSFPFISHRNALYCAFSYMHTSSCSSEIAINARLRWQQRATPTSTQNTFFSGWMDTSFLGWKFLYVVASQSICIFLIYYELFFQRFTLIIHPANEIFLSVSLDSCVFFHTIAVEGRWYALP